MINYKTFIDATHKTKEFYCVKILSNIKSEKFDEISRVATKRGGEYVYGAFSFQRRKYRDGFVEYLKRTNDT